MPQNLTFMFYFLSVKFATSTVWCQRGGLHEYIFQSNRLCEFYLLLTPVTKSTSRRKGIASERLVSEYAISNFSPLPLKASVEDGGNQLFVKESRV
jgi:hypothetical protein